MTRVLPDPAPASIRRGPSVWATAFLWFSFRFSRMDMIIPLYYTLPSHRLPDSFFAVSEARRKHSRCLFYYHPGPGQDGFRRYRLTIAAGKQRRGGEE